MRIFFTISKRSLGIALCGVVVLFMGAMWFSSIKASAIDGSTHANRMLYINSLNVAVDEEDFGFKETVIPEKFTQVYEEYNRLQLRSGFDLRKFKGCKVTVYSYPVTGENKNLTLLVYDGAIIGGDISETAINGKMMPLGK